MPEAGKFGTPIAKLLRPWMIGQVVSIKACVSYKIDLGSASKC